MPTPNEDKDISLSDSVAAAFDAHEKESDANAGKETPPAAAPAKEPAKAATATPAKADDKQSAPDVPKDSTASQTSAATATAIVAPVSWNAEDKAIFAKLPPEAQKIIAARESERDKFVNGKGEEFANYRKRYDSLEQVLEPRQSAFARMGMSPAQVVNQLLALADQADRDFGGFIREQAKLRNIDLTNLITPKDNEYVDPTIKQLQDKIAELEGAQHQRTQQEVTSQQQGILRQVEDFANEKDASGNAVRPHYAKVEGEMDTHIMSIRRANPSLPTKDVLQQAYDRAVWANPEVRAALVEQERATAAAKLIDEEKARAGKARSAAVSHRGSPTGVSSSQTHETVEDTVRSTLAAFGF